MSGLLLLDVYGYAAILKCHVKKTASIAMQYFCLLAKTVSKFPQMAIFLISLQPTYAVFFSG